MKNKKTVSKSLAKKLINLPRFNLTERQLCDLELILNGGFAPLTGFLSERDYDSVVTKMRLSDGNLWPMPIVFDVSEETNIKIGQEIILCDMYGVPRAFMAADSIYRPDRTKEARFVFGTTDTAHPGVRYLLENTQSVYVGGKVVEIPHEEDRNFPELRQTPTELKRWFKQHGWEKIIAFQTRNPIHRGHYELLRRAAKEIGGNLLIQPSVGLTKNDDIEPVTRIKCYKHITEKYLKNAKLSLLPLAMRMGGPREALWHAIIRKNYGATHFIIGRDHAGPGKDKAGKPFYGPYDAQNLVIKYAKEIGIKPFPVTEVSYVPSLDKHLPANEVPQGAEVQTVSGTEFRAMLRNGNPVPEWFSFPEIIAELRKSVGGPKGLTIFLTGLPSSGKSTIARLLESKLMEIQDKKITVLDGDVVRQHLSHGLGFNAEDRNRNIQRIGYVASEITKHGGIAICAALAPYQSSRNYNRQLISRHGTYVEVFVNAPVKVCEARDVKGLYKKARAGELKNFTGVSDPYERPENPEIEVRTDRYSAGECIAQIVNYLQKNNLI